jgi:hypothetical protein
MSRNRLHWAHALSQSRIESRARLTENGCGQKPTLKNLMLKRQPGVEENVRDETIGMETEC